MAVKLFYSISAVFLVILLTSCASDPSKEFSYDYSTAEIGTFDGFWEGRVDCRYADGFEPRLWVKISKARGEFAFGNRNALAGSGFELEGSLYADLDPQNGRIRWGAVSNHSVQQESSPYPSRVNGCRTNFIYGGV